LEAIVQSSYKKIWVKYTHLPWSLFKCNKYPLYFLIEHKPPLSVSAVQLPSPCFVFLLLFFFFRKGTEHSLQFTSSLFLKLSIPFCLLQARCTPRQTIKLSRPPPSRPSNQVFHLWLKWNMWKNNLVAVLKLDQEMIDERFIFMVCFSSCIYFYIVLGIRFWEETSFKIIK
jgi:hypothetical protein